MLKPEKTAMQGRYNREPYIKERGYMFAGKIKKFICRLIALALIVCIIGAVFYGYKGYEMYREAVSKTPISSIAEDIYSKEHFTEYESLPQIYIDAVIAAEDKRFFRHKGIDPLAIARAAFNDIIAGAFVEGGSTIPQQLAKNELFTQDKKIERKFADAIGALAIERQYSKKQIFEMYVNSIYFGSGYYGIYDAAMGYFGKTPEQLDDYEAVMLAGLPNAPSNYSPDSNTELAEKRMSVVLKRMVKCHKITQEEAEEIQNKSPF